MPQNKIKNILSAPITLLRWSTEEERGLFLSKDKNDCFCTFGLASGQTFIGRIPAEQGIYTFKPIQNLLPHLLCIEWKKTPQIEDLGYVTTCYTSTKISEAETACYKDILAPKPDKSTKHPQTKIAFRYYKYHPLLEQARSIQSAVGDFRKKERALINSQRNLGKILFSEKRPFSFQDRSRT